MAFETANPRLTPRQLRAKFFKPIVGRESTELDVVPSNVARRWRMERAEAARRVKEAEANTKAWEDYHRRWALERQSEAAEDEQAAKVVQAIAIEGDEAPPNNHQDHPNPGGGLRALQHLAHRFGFLAEDHGCRPAASDRDVPCQEADAAHHGRDRLQVWRARPFDRAAFGSQDHGAHEEYPDLAAEIADIKKSLGAE
jgi:hypothetical protein